VNRLGGVLDARIRMGGMKRRVPAPALGLTRRHERGAAAVEFALVLPILLVILLGIIDFGLYVYSDLQLTHSARDAVRYLSLGDVADASAVVDGLIADPPPQTSVSGGVTTGSPLGPCSVSVAGTYHCLTPLPALIGIGQDLSINVSATMRQVN
jgi:Flp pilus assembly protein TadG